MPQDQTGIVEYLSSPAPYDGGEPVEVVQTHGAYVFLCGDTALKLKRAVRYDYMDLSTVEKRRVMLNRELELNKPVAPDIYLDVQPVTLGTDDTLAIGGSGRALDWVLRMRRFPEKDELPNIMGRGELDGALADRIGVALAAYHQATPVRAQPGGVLMADIIDELQRVFSEFPKAEGAGEVAKWFTAVSTFQDRVRPLLDARGLQGHVRRAHGDLHAANIVLLNGKPVPFDALEFDEQLGTCDVLYDLAFLLMDLCHHDHAFAACRVLDAWLNEFEGAEDDGLAALPLFLSVRAAIRAMVLLQTDAARSKTGHSKQSIAAYLRQACDYLEPRPSRLIAIGGVSGSGKSVLARSLSVGLGQTPGAVVLSSDATRKAGRNKEQRLPENAYSGAARHAVYETLLRRARAVLQAGHAAILDATFLSPEQRQAAEQVARDLGVPFVGLWLTAPLDVLEHRIKERKDDASDANVAVLRNQLAQEHRETGWIEIDASGEPTSALKQARSILPELFLRR